MAAASKDDVLNALRRVPGPSGSGDIVSLGLVSDIVVSDGKVIFSISVPAERARELEPLRQAAEAAVRAVPGVEQVMVALTAERRPGARSSAAAASAPPAGAPPMPHAAAAAEGRRARASAPSSRSPPARAASANPPSPSISRSACRRSG